MTKGLILAGAFIWEDQKRSPFTTTSYFNILLPKSSNSAVVLPALVVGQIHPYIIFLSTFPTFSTVASSFKIFRRHFTLSANQCRPIQLRQSGASEVRGSTLGCQLVCQKRKLLEPKQIFKGLFRQDNMFILYLITVSLLMKSCKWEGNVKQSAQSEHKLFHTFV